MKIFRMFYIVMHFQRMLYYHRRYRKPQEPKRIKVKKPLRLRLQEQRNARDAAKDNMEALKRKMLLEKAKRQGMKP